MSFGWASLIQGIAFDASHIPQDLEAGLYLPAAVPWQFSTGMANALAVGYLWYRSRRLPAAILFHLAVLI
jgi:membrane protease YdiL (CAAX protease family)